ncbi:MAG: tyrosine--tRNA ligase, partial [Chloroflexi bacterium]|nr:tyrosine--tRNA ligase [Chloroflexota bacterium]
MSPTKKGASAVDYVLSRGVIEIIPKGSLAEALQSGKKLRLKLGLDPSKPDLHIGHAVLLRKLRTLQEMGHQVVLIVGDWTAQIGDPSGQSIMRPMLTAEDVKANADTYMRQFFHVVDKAKTEVRWQSEWFDDFKLSDVVRLAGRFTVAQMLQREDFRQRFDAKQPLGIHELLYPLLQAYDSVVIDADVEFGGTDQLFNMLVGRELQQAMGKEPQIVFTMKLLVGTDGVQKMSKSLGNTIDLEDPPGEQYGKVMSIPDDVLMDYLEAATDLPDEELTYIRKQL